MRSAFTCRYLDRYLRLRSSAKELVTAWLPVVAAARIGENTGEQPRMLALIKGSSLALNAEFSTRAVGRRGRT
jgi:hypothetical protein